MPLANPAPKTKAAQQAETIRSKIAQIRKLLIDSHIDIFTALYATEGVNPQAILDELGSDAAELFYQGGINCRFLALIDATPEKWDQVTSALDGVISTHELTIPLHEEHYVPPVEYTINEDGTVTIINT